MCRPISGIITKDKILFSEIEHSHTAILEEYGIENSRKNAETLFVRAELYPQNQDMFSSIADWKFNVDQDIIPEWFVKEHEELRMREAVKVYAQNYIHVGKNCFELSSGLHWIKDCKNVSLLGSAKVKQLISSQVGEMRGSSQVGMMRGSSQVGKMRESSQVGEMWESSQVGKMWGSSQVGEMRESSQVGEMWESSQVGKMWGSSQVTISEIWADNVNHENITLCNNAIIKDRRTKTIYQNGDWKLVSIQNPSTAKTI